MSQSGVTNLTVTPRRLATSVATSISKPENVAVLVLDGLRCVVRVGRDGQDPGLDDLVEQAAGDGGRGCGTGRSRRCTGPGTRTGARWCRGRGGGGCRRRGGRAGRGEQDARQQERGASSEGHGFSSRTRAVGKCAGIGRRWTSCSTQAATAQLTSPRRAQATASATWYHGTAGTRAAGTTSTFTPNVTSLPSPDRTRNRYRPAGHAAVGLIAAGASAGR